MDVVESQIAGSAPNVAVGLARSGKKTAVLSNMGDDLTYDLAVKKLKKEGVVTKLIKVIKGAKSAYSVVLNFMNERTIFTSHIHNAYSLPKDFPKTKWVYVSEMGSKYESFYKTLTKHIKENKVCLGLNPGTTQIKEKSPALLSLIKQVEVLLVNHEEAKELLKTKTDDQKVLAKKLIALGPKLVIITDGPKGAYGFDGKDLIYCPIFPGERIEATGAGDAFASAFITALIEKQDLATALKWGSVNAASVVHQVGPQPGLLSKTQIKSRLSRNKQYSVTYL